MKLLSISVMAACLTLSACSTMNGTTTLTNSTMTPPVPSLGDVRAVAPALERYTTGTLLGDLWKRPGLSARDRSIVTLSVLIASNQVLELPYHVNRALDNGVKPGEISEMITHLAFYSGWANATGAVLATKTVFEQRGITSEQLPPAEEKLLPIDETAEAKRAAGVDHNFGKIGPGVRDFTTEVLFRDLWLRPGLAPRDRSVVTVSALVATGQVAQITYHLNRAMDNGLSEKKPAKC